MANKVTKVQNYNSIIEKYGIAGEDKEFLLHEVALIEKRNAYKSDKPTKTQRENAVAKDGIASMLVEGNAYTATDVAHMLGENVSPQKASALLKQMVEAGTVVKATVKRKSYFALVGTDIEAVVTAESEATAE